MNETNDKPWLSEPDRIEFEHAGLPCLMKRSCTTGVWCGYVAVLPGHPLHGIEDIHDERLIWIDVHGGLTYAGACNEELGNCHVAKQGEADNVHWLGFDTSHGFDLRPRDLDYGLRPLPDATYRDQDYVRDQVERLAEQLRAVAKPFERDNAGHDILLCDCLDCQNERRALELRERP